MLPASSCPVSKTDLIPDLCKRPGAISATYPWRELEASASRGGVTISTASIRADSNGRGNAVGRKITATGHDPFLTGAVPPIGHAGPTLAVGSDRPDPAAGLPDQANPAGPAMTVAACNNAPSAVLSKHSAPLAIVAKQTPRKTALRL
jgi:hypothetical protein